MKINQLTTWCATMGLAGMMTAAANATVLYSSDLTTSSLSAGNLVGQDGWANHSGTGSFIQVGAAGTTLASGSGSREDANVGFAAIGSGQTYYFGFDVVVTSGSSDYFAHFKDIGTDFTTRVILAPFSGADFTFALGAESGTAESTWATGLSYNTTYRVVGAYSQGTNAVELWVDPTSESSTSITGADAAAAAVSAFALRQGSGPSGEVISNLVVATTFDEAADLVPEPASLALITLGGLAIARRRVA